MHFLFCPSTSSLSPVHLFLSSPSPTSPCPPHPFCLPAPSLSPRLSVCLFFLGSTPLALGSTPLVYPSLPPQLSSPPTLFVQYLVPNSNACPLSASAPTHLLCPLLCCLLSSRSTLNQHPLLDQPHSCHKRPWPHHPPPPLLSLAFAHLGCNNLSTSLLAPAYPAPREALLILLPSVFFIDSSSRGRCGAFFRRVSPIAVAASSSPPFDIRAARARERTFPRPPARALLGPQRARAQNARVPGRDPRRCNAP